MRPLLASSKLRPQTPRRLILAASPFPSVSTSPSQQSRPGPARSTNRATASGVLLGFRLRRINLASLLEQTPAIVPYYFVKVRETLFTTGRDRCSDGEHGNEKVLVVEVLIALRNSSLIPRCVKRLMQRSPQPRKHHQINRGPSRPRKRLPVIQQACESNERQPSWGSRIGLSCQDPPAFCTDG